ncbi:hypothetical protein DB32_001758 [Sandaracinus amylolyticus]|uniref:Uncharacterized protein n=1 Tax=Sandaracinus amylolyticus TaxID=927083 RepID=A0A0F6SE56_9BACT|nr:hypothetical protein DB32_001758 [Sandaracinus amylolyticus]
MVLAVVAMAGRADAQDVRRAVLLGHIEPRLLGRVRGQTGDLPWALDRVENGAGDFERALAIGRARRAQVVVWFEREGGAIVVNVAEVDERRLFARSIEVPMGEASAALEAAALVVRGALSDLAQGGHVGIVMPAPPPVAPEPEPEPQPPPALPREEPDARLLVSLGAGIAIDGEAPRAHVGPAARIAVDVGIVELAVEGRSGVQEELDRDALTVLVTRFAARAGAAIELIDDGEWRATIGAGLGIAGHLRSTDVRDDSLEPTSPSTVATFLASGEVRGQWFPGAGPVGLELAVGADVLAIAPRFVVQRADGLEVLHAPWSVQPTVSLGLVIRAP